VNVIGQKRLISTIEKYADENNFPRFLILLGDKGSGRKTLSKFISKKLNAFYVPCELGVDSVREVIENCYKCSGATLYCFPDADTMSISAKNSLLKITEEPPRSAYFVLTLQNINNVPETIKSRAAVLTIQPYQDNEIVRYMALRSIENPLIAKLSTTPGDVEAFLKIDVEEFHNFVVKVLDNIGDISGVNALKIPQSLSFKEGDNGYDPALFVNSVYMALRDMIINWEEDEPPELLMRYGAALTETSRCCQELRTVALKKDSTIDMWILRLRMIMRGD
jgi:hypothetical protein